MKWFNLVMLLCICTTGALTAEKLRLEDAVRIGKENSRILKISAASRDAEEARSTEARSRLYPSLGAFGSYTRIEEGKFKLTTTNQPQAFAVGDVVADNYVFRIGLRQPLFTGFRLSGEVDAANASADAAQLDFSMAESNLVYNITGAYWSLFQSKESETFTRENVKRLESDRDATKRMLDAGSATQNDLLRVEVQLSNAKIAEIEARNDAELARMNLNNIIGMPVETEIELLSVPGEDQPTGKTRPEQKGSIHDLVETAENLRPDLKAASARVAAATSRVSAAQGGLWPEIDLTANYIYNSPNSRYQPITPEFLGTWDVGVSVALDLWSGGGTVSRVDEAQATLAQVRLQEEQLKANVEIEIHRAKLELVRSEEKVSVAELAASQAEEQLRVTTEKYRVGLATSTELLDAEVSLLQTQTQSSAARVGLALAHASLFRALGQTLEPGSPDE